MATRRPGRILAAVLVGALVTGACASGDGQESGGQADTEAVTVTSQGLDTASVDSGGAPDANPPDANPPDANARDADAGENDNIGDDPAQDPAEDQAENPADDSAEATTGEPTDDESDDTPDDTVQACADVVDASADGTDGVYRFSATVRSGDTGWDKYADAWEVRTVDGMVLGTRELAHPHETEQPFTRSLNGVEVPPGTAEVVLAARDSVNGFCGVEFTLAIAG